MKPGYCAVTADGLHIGHINFFKKCKEHCDHLTVGVMSDECVKEYKGRYPVMNQRQRIELVGLIMIVNNVFIQNTFQFPDEIIKEYIIFDSDEHRRDGVYLYFPRLEGISSTKLKENNEGLNISKL